MDITDFPDPGNDIQVKAVPVYPTSMAQTSSVTSLISKLSTANMKTNLETFTAYNNRYSSLLSPF
jgi:leucyl aminopeptidase